MKPNVMTIDGTALGVAHARAQYGLPLAREILELFAGTEVPADHMAAVTAKGPYFVARYLMSNKLARELNFRHGFELASGLSGRGLVFTQDPNVQFMVTGKEESLIWTRHIVDHVAPGRPNLQIAELNVTTPGHFERALSQWDCRERFAVYQEGLFLYQPLEHRRFVLESMRPFLAHRRAVIITSDSNTKSTLANSPYLRKFSEEIGFDIIANAPVDLRTIARFNRECGYYTAFRPMMEVLPEITRPGSIFTPEYARTALSGMFSAVLTPIR